MNIPGFGFRPGAAPVSVQSPLFAGGRKRSADEAGGPATEDETGARKSLRRSERIMISAMRRYHDQESELAIGRLKRHQAPSDQFMSRLRNPDDDALKHLVQDLDYNVPIREREGLFARLKRRLPRKTEPDRHPGTYPCFRLNILRLPVEIQEHILRFKLAQHPEIWQDTLRTLFKQESSQDFSKQDLQDLFLITRHGASLRQPTRGGSTVLHRSIENFEMAPLFNYFMRFAPRQLPIGQLDSTNLTPLDTAVLMGSGSQVRALLAKGESVTKETIKQAALWGEPDILDELLKAHNPDLSTGQIAKYQQRALAQQESNQALNLLTMQERQSRYDETLENYLLAATGQPVNLKATKAAFAALAKSGLPLDRLNSVWGLGPLHCAAQEGHHSIVKMSLRTGARVNHRARITESTPLHLAVENGHGSIVHLLLQGNAKVNLKNFQGQTPLHLAAIQGHRDIFKALADRGACLQELDDQGDNILHAAASGGDLEIVAMLLNSGANLNERGQFGFTPLAMAAEGGHLAVIDLLLSSGANPNLAAAHGGMPLHWAADLGRLDIVDRLLAADAELQHLDSNGATVLHRAVASGNIQLVDRLLESGLAIDAQTKQGNTVLHLAVESGNIPLLRRLIQAGAPLDKTNQFGNTPLYQAIAVQEPGAVTDLLQAGADVNRWEATASNNGVVFTPLHCAAEQGDLTMVNQLLQAGADARLGDTLVRAAYNPDAAVMTRLLEVDAPRLRKDWLGRNALHVAAMCDNLPVLRVLQGVGFPLNSLDSHGGNALYWAARGGSPEVIEALRDAGIFINQVNNYGETPLHTAVKAGRPISVIQALLDAGVSMNAMDREGHTAAYYARRNDEQEILELLQDHHTFIV